MSTGRPVLDVHRTSIWRPIDVNNIRNWAQTVSKSWWVQQTSNGRPWKFVGRLIWTSNGRHFKVHWESTRRRMDVSAMTSFRHLLDVSHRSNGRLLDLINVDVHWTSNWRLIDAHISHQKFPNQTRSNRRPIDVPGRLLDIQNGRRWKVHWRSARCLMDISSMMSFRHLLDIRQRSNGCLGYRLLQYWLTDWLVDWFWCVTSINQSITQSTNQPTM